jgi:hypothetical protein
MALIRLLVCLAVAWIITAIGYRALKEMPAAVPAPTFYVPRPSFLDVTETGTSNCRLLRTPALVDRRTGNRTPIEPPHDLTWDLLSVSPWLDQDGKVEVVARWANHASDDSSEPFCGLGLLKLPEAIVVARIPTEVLPTGRACFVPGRPGEIVFPAGDGQLYRCTLAENTRGDAEAEVQRPVEHASGSTAIHPLVWGCPAPDSGIVLLNDPAWPTDPRLAHLIFVSLTSQKLCGPKQVFDPPEVWWLELGDSCETIVRAGPLQLRFPKPAGAHARVEVPARQRSFPRMNSAMRLTGFQRDYGGRGAKSRESEIDWPAQRFPTVVVGQNGDLHLVCLILRRGSPRIELICGRLQVDLKTGMPSVGPIESFGDGIPEGFCLAAPVVAADGRSVLVVNRSGALVRVKLPDAG